MSTKVYFQNIQDVLSNYIRDAHDSIIIVVAWFTDRELFSLLLMKALEGVEVIIVLNDDEINNGPSSLPFSRLMHHNSKVYFIKNDFTYIMHNKFCLIDFHIIASGSFNWTYKASNNDENLIVITGDQKIVRDYYNEFGNIVNRNGYHVKSMDFQDDYTNIKINNIEEINKFYYEITKKFLFDCNNMDDIEYYTLENFTESIHFIEISCGKNTFLANFVFNGKYFFGSEEFPFEEPYNYEEWEEDSINTTKSEDEDDDYIDNCDEYANEDEYEDEVDPIETREMIEVNMDECPIIETSVDLEGYLRYYYKTNTDRCEINHDKINLDKLIKYCFGNGLIETCCSSKYILVKIGQISVHSQCLGSDESYGLEANVYLSIRNTSYTSFRFEFKPFNIQSFKLPAVTLSIKQLEKLYIEYCIEIINCFTQYPNDFSRQYYDDVRESNKDYELWSEFSIDRVNYQFIGVLFVYDSLAANEMVYPLHQIYKSPGSYRSNENTIHWEWDIDHLVDNLKFQDAIKEYISKYYNKGDEFFRFLSIKLLNRRFNFLLKIKPTK